MTDEAFRAPAWRAESPEPPLCDQLVRETHRTVLLGLAAGMIALLAWASLTQIDAVTRSTGMIVPFTQNQIVQHLEGGIVSEILVREGDRVEKDQVLVRIRDVQSETTLQQTRTQLAAKRATLARLEAELAGAPAVTFPTDLAENRILDSERELFSQRQRDHSEQIFILEDKIRQQELALAGLKARRSNLQRERELSAQRAQSLQRLSDLGAVSKNELLQALTALQQIDTRIEDLAHDIPQTEAALSEAARQRNAALLKFRSDAVEEKTKVFVEISQLIEAVAALKERAVRTDIRAPVSGTVNKQMIATVGGVIAAGAPIMEIVPRSDTIAIEAQLPPQDRADIWPGTKAVVKITAYEYSVYGSLDAQVVDISPDIIKEKDTPPYFRVRLNAPNRLGDNRPIIPGMMANVDILTKRHTVLQYLLTPLAEVRDMAFRR
ncbi:HlyD family type I secretion periplasmic adaptor subunit [Methylobacterium organophilum]|uniref:Membrane fusion protein (MFP) family protein n=1 Tax=Methylobacterium organophilum TaxID=410 RepID=A0ABQ4TCZ0_METOR|nr:HlyD family type I secretion periplasmic adaptor subunit [Methylobacterium organophilum]UMY18181.1 HlyD family type I secretion periplasmic adaptor subunit [Methylobacterium organophilum]GJE27985.1 Type I secretion system membrane fusion protein PrsE [Methylobacterium organophilum]